MSDDQTRIRPEILGELKGTNQRLDQTNQRLGETNERLDQTNQRLGETNERLEDAVTDLGGRIDQTNDRLETMGRDLGGRIDQTNVRLDTMGRELGDRIERTSERLTRQMVIGFTTVREGLNRLDQRFEGFLLGAHGQEHADLRERVSRIEQRLGLEPDEG